MRPEQSILTNTQNLHPSKLANSPAKIRDSSTPPHLRRSRLPYHRDGLLSLTASPLTTAAHDRCACSGSSRVPRMI